MIAGQRARLLGHESQIRTEQVCRTQPIPPTTNQTVMAHVLVYVPLHLPSQKVTLTGPALTFCPQDLYRHMQINAHKHVGGGEDRSQCTPDSHGPVHVATHTNSHQPCQWTVPVITPSPHTHGTMHFDRKLFA